MVVETTEMMCVPFVESEFSFKIEQALYVEINSHCLLMPINIVLG